MTSAWGHDPQVTKMKIKLRKANGFHRYHEVYQWQPEGNGRWYNIHRRDIVILGSTDLIRGIFNAALAGQELSLRGAYFRHSYAKTLVIEPATTN